MEVARRIYTDGSKLLRVDGLKEAVKTKIIQDEFNKPVGRIKCARCNSVLEYNQSDIIRKRHVGDGIHDYYHCPACNKESELSKAERLPASE